MKALCDPSSLGITSISKTKQTIIFWINRNHLKKKLKQIKVWMIFTNDKKSLELLFNANEFKSLIFNFDFF
jgi:tRNA A37 threonylcarbamoyladenosine dehydratase